METSGQGQRRAARLRWWQEVLEHVDRPSAATWDEVLDETVRLRFHLALTSGSPREAEAAFGPGVRFQR